jgi:DNA-directed RNA polymerase sigma subunit (sigma70/sigma32)
LCRSPKISIPSVSSVRDHGGEPTAQELARLLGVSPRVRVLERVDREPVSLDELVAEDVMRHGDLIPAAPQAARRYSSARPAGILKGQR